MTRLACRVGARRWLIACAVLIGLPVGVSADTITLNAGGTGDFATIQAAIDDAGTQNGDVIELQQGTYTGSGNRDVDFGGKDITVRSTDPNDADVVGNTVMDCQAQGRGFYFHNGETSSAMVAGLKIINGSAERGGGIKTSGASPTISRCVLYGNSANQGTSRHGGAICVFGEDDTPRIEYCEIASNTATGGGGIAIHGSPEFVECAIHSNSATGNGGGLWVEGTTSITVWYCTITGNSAAAGGGLHFGNGASTASGCIITANTASSSGGGIVANGNLCTIEDCTIADNYADDYGGGVSCVGTWLTLSNCQLVSNEAGARGGGAYVAGVYDDHVSNCLIVDNVATNGGGLYCAGGSTYPNYILHCIIAGNRTPSGFGGGLSVDGDWEIEHLVIVGNVADYDGGGVDYESGNEPLIWDSVIAANESGRYGGGICVYGSPGGGKITGATIADNEAGTNGGGLDYYVGSGEEDQIKNTIVWRNTVNGSADQINDWSDGTLTIDYSDVQGGWTGSGSDNINQEPKFAIDNFGNDQYWTSAGSYNSSSFQTTLTDENANWVDHALTDMVINPDVAQTLQFVVVNNTATTITVWGDASSIAAVNDKYSIANYNLTAEQDGSSRSPCIDAGSNSAGVRFSDTTSADGTTTTIKVVNPGYTIDDEIEYDNDGVLRTVTDVTLGTVAFAPALSSASQSGKNVKNYGWGDIEGDNRIVDGDGVASAFVDMGADEYTPYDARLADPWFDGTIPKTQNNIVLLPFNIYGEVSLPAQGPALTITRLDTSGDVSTDFDYSVVSSKSPNDTLKVKEDGQKLTDQTWYRCEPDPDLDVPEDFDLDVCTLRGDALDSERVTTADYTPVKAHLGERTDQRYDLSGTGRVTTADYSVVKDNLGNRKPAKP